MQAHVGRLRRSVTTNVDFRYPASQGGIHEQVSLLQLRVVRRRLRV